jgi:hypothetical protein
MNKFQNSFTITKRSAKIFAIFILLACGPGMADYDEFMSFFKPESSNASTQNQRYNYTSQFFYNENEGEYIPIEETNDEKILLDVSAPENIEAWLKYCENKVTHKDIEDGVYGAIEDSKLKAYFKSYNNQLAIDYLTFVQEAEQNAIGSEGGELDTEVTINPDKDIKILTQLFNRAKHDFLKERIAFQLVKTYSLADKHKQTLDAYDKFIVPIKNKTFISDWALMRKGEAEASLKNVDEAYYDFAMVFDRSESHRKQADLNTRWRIQGFQEGALKFCKNDHEKACLYALAGIKPATDALPMLEKMVELDPQNHFIELIMAREINKNEADYYKQMYSEFNDEATQKLVDEKRGKATDYWSKLKEFSIKCSENQQLTKTGFWEIASAYMTYVEGDFEKSEEFLNQSKAIKTSNKGLKSQISIQELLLIAKRSKQITPETEAKVITILESFAKPKDFRVSNAILESCNLLAKTYRGVKDVGTNDNKNGWFSSCSNKKLSKANAETNVPHSTAKAYLMSMLTTNQVNSSAEYGGFESQKDMFKIEDTTSLATIEKVIAYFSDKNKTDFDIRLQKLVGFNTDHLFTLMGRRAMDEANYAKASEAFSKVSTSVWKNAEWKYFDEDPFYISAKFNDDKKNPNYTPFTFAKKMAALEAELKSNPNDAESAYSLGCGTYQTTYGGNSWILRRHGWSGAEVNTYTKGDFNSDYYQTNKAKAFFQKAMKSSNPELAAKACFGAALCERDAYDVYLSLQESKPNETTEDFRARMETVRDSKYSVYFKELYAKYYYTKYQKQVLQECGDYTLFNGGK